MEAVADDVIAAVLTADTNETVTEQVRILNIEQEQRRVNYASSQKDSSSDIPAPVVKRCQKLGALSNCHSPTFVRAGSV
jgi:hypothetical protein